MARHLAASMVAYEMVLIDCPPSLGPLTHTALSSSTEVLMPIQCEYFAMEGLTQMIEIIRRVMQDKARRLQFGGIVLTMYDHRLELTSEVEKEVRDFFGEIVFTTVIPRDVAVSEAPSHGLSVLDYAPRGRGARGVRRTLYGGTRTCLRIDAWDEGLRHCSAGHPNRAKWAPMELPPLPKRPRPTPPAKTA